MHAHVISFHLQGPSRTSNMDAAIMLLTGHEGEIYSAKFHPEGSFLASGGFDRNICKIWVETEWNIFRSFQITRLIIHGAL